MTILFWATAENDIQQFQRPSEEGEVNLEQYQLTLYRNLQQAYQAHQGNLPVIQVNFIGDTQTFAVAGPTVSVPAWDIEYVKGAWAPDQKEQLIKALRTAKDAKHEHEKSLLNQELEKLQASLSELSSAIARQKSQYQLQLKAHEEGFEEERRGFGERLEQISAEKDQQLAEQARLIEQERLGFDERLEHASIEKDKALAKQERRIQAISGDFEALAEEKEALERKIEDLIAKIDDLDQQLTAEKRERQGERDADTEVRSQLGERVNGEIEALKKRLLDAIQEQRPVPQQVFESEASDLEEEEFEAELDAEESGVEDNTQAPMAANKPQENESLLARLNKRPLLKNGLQLTFSAGVGALFFYAGGAQAVSELLAGYILPSTGLDAALTSLATAFAFAGTKGVEYGLTSKSAVPTSEIKVTASVTAPQNITKSTAQSQQKAASSLRRILDSDSEEDSKDMSHEASSETSSNSRKARSKQKWGTPLRDTIQTRAVTRANRAENDSNIEETTTRKKTVTKR